jgi:hypothetical protein
LNRQTDFQRSTGEASVMNRQDSICDRAIKLIQDIRAAWPMIGRRNLDFTDAVG